MATPNDMREAVVEMLWSQWHELGVAATVPRRHSDDFIDPEPLIAFTAVHGDLDARLRDESIDWVLKYGTYVSKARLKNVLDDWGALDDSLFRQYAATVNANGRLGWPAGGGRPLAFRSRARSVLEDLKRPALLSLRVRAIFGVGARAELVRAFVSRPQLAMTAADLSLETSYGKRNVLNELEPLRFAGVVKSFRAANADRYSLAMGDQIHALVGPIPQRFTRWTSAFAALHLMLRLFRTPGKTSNLQNAIGAIRFLETHAHVLASADMYPPPLPPGVAAWPVFVEWASGQARGFARF